METTITKMESLIARRLVILSLIGEYTAKGLGNCQNVVTLKKELAQIGFDQYKDKYPTYLFFTDEQFDKIVKRNKLVVFGISSYTGYIPDECFKAIQNETIDKDDLRENTCTVKIKSSYTRKRFVLMGVNDKMKEEIKNGDVCSAAYVICKIKFNGEKNHFLDVMKGMLGKDYWDLDIVAKDHRYKDCRLDISITAGKDGSGLHIACPKSMIDKRKQKRNITEYFKIKYSEPKDPIVFRYVKDGVLVITFWK
jgi:hypothetical protein